MPSFIKSLLTRKAPAETPAPKPGSAGAPTTHSLDIPNTELRHLRYPPLDTGFPNIDPATVLDGQQELLARIARTAGLSQEDYDTRFMPLIHKLGRYVHLLPATSTTYFRGEGGLLRMSLEIGMYSLQAANASVFPVGGIERRYTIQPKWCLGTFVAGICSQLFRTVSQMAVVSRAGAQWPALIEPLADWAEREEVDTYFVRWLDTANTNIGQAAGAFIVNQIVPRELLQWLGEDNHHVLPAMAATVAATEHSHRDNPIARITTPVISRVIDDDIKRNSLNYGHLTVGSHLEPHVIDAMRRLVKEGAWVPNRPNSVLWTGRDGTYLRWARAAADITAFLIHDGFGGVPQDPGILAEVLLRVGVAARKSAQTPYWTIVLPDSGEIVEGTLKLIDSEFLYEGEGTDTSPPTKSRAFTLETQIAKTTADSAPAPEGQIALELGYAPAPPEKAAPEKTAKAAAKRAAKKDDTAPPAPASVSALSPTASESPAQPAEQPESPKAGKPAPSGNPLDELKKEHALLLTEIIQAKRDGKLSGRIAVFAFGVGISQDELRSHGQQVMPFIEELLAKKWLWIDMNKPTRNSHLIAHEGVEDRWIVLRPDIARAIGLG